MYHEYLIIYYGSYREDDDRDDVDDDNAASSYASPIHPSSSSYASPTHPSSSSYASLTHRQGLEQKAEHMQRLWSELMQHLLLESIHTVHLGGLVVACSKEEER